MTPRGMQDFPEVLNSTPSLAAELFRVVRSRTDVFQSTPSTLACLFNSILQLIRPQARRALAKRFVSPA